MHCGSCGASHVSGARARAVVGRPLDAHPAPDPARRCAVVGDIDAAVEMDDALAVLGYRGRLNPVAEAGIVSPTQTWLAQ